MIYVLLGGGEDIRYGSPPVEEPTYAGLKAYERRCERVNRRGAQAQVVYEASRRMTVGDTETVRAAVTLDQGAPPETVLPRTDAAGEPGLVVSCRLQARLSGSGYEFEINTTDWVDRSVYATDTARWVWDVTPKVGGDHTLTLFVRPIVAEGESGTALAAQADVRDYLTTVHVTVPWNERANVLMTQVASTLNVGEGLVKALTALIVAISALVAAVAGIRKARIRKAQA